MTDLRNPKVIWFKGGPFLLIGLVASALLLLEAPSWRVGLLLGLAVWVFCRAYYFAFYVIEHYVDPGFKFAGLTSFLEYIIRRNANRSTTDRGEKS